MGWEQLLDIAKEARDEARAAASRQPVACPNDGTPLAEASDGGLYCPFDGWRPGYDPAD